jgi:translation initiation factor IF-2
MSEKIKVFELAPELGLKPLELVTKLKEIGVVVKSHMSELEDDQVAQIKAHLTKKEEPKAAEKKTTVKKKAAAPAAPAEKKTTTLKKKVVVAPPKKKVEIVVEEKQPEKAAKSTIVRKKKAIELEPIIVVEEKPKEESVKQEATTTAQTTEAPKREIPKDETAAQKEVREAEEKKHGHGAVKHLTARELEIEEEKKKDKKKVKVGKKDGKVEILDIFELKKQSSTRAVYGVKKKAAAGREQKKTLITTMKASKRKVRISGDGISVGELAKEMGIKAAEIMQKLFAMGTMATINQKLDLETATLIATEFHYELEFAGFDEKEVIAPDEDKVDDMVPISPVVTMMGHVDHGKTSILDAIRKSNVADKEAGGITQHVGAHEVELEKGVITFLDTPGHEAFTEMRARGSQVTDIVVLVVAADDGVMPQTRESIDHARAAGVEIVVALNKIDKPNANVDMVKKQLSELELLPEDWGGQTIVVPTAAKKGEGIKQLLEAILLQAEIMELKANPNRPGEGIVVEGRLDKGMGPIASIIIKRGTLKVGDYVVAGTSSGRIKSIRNSHGKVVQSVAPGRFGEILGLDSVPMAGEKVNCVATENDASKLVDHRIDEKRRHETVESKKPLSLDEMMLSVAKGEMKELKLVVKADTQGSIEALKASLEKLSDETVAVKIVLAGIGGVTSNDVNLALASGAVIIAFNVRPDSKASAEAEAAKLDIRYYDVIYSCLEDMEKAKTGMLEPVDVEKVNGQAEVREVFNISKLGTIAGCSVKTGKVIRNSLVRVIRDGVVVYTGKIKSLKRFKDDAREVLAGLECGMSIEGFNDIKPGDIFESYTINKVDSTGAIVGSKKE